MTTSPRQARTHAVIEPVTGRVPLRLRETWRSRELLGLLAWRDISTRYRQSLLGVGWAALQPIAMAAVFTVFLGRLVRVPSEGAPYAVFVLSGLVPWAFCGNAVTAASDSLVGSSGVITKVYFPRLILPIASIVAWLPDLLIATVVLFGAMAVYGLTPVWTAVFVPLFAAGALMTAAAVGIALAPLNVGYRDVRYLSSLMIQLWMFATPVVYPLSEVPENWRSLYALNPMVGIVSGYRWAVLGTAQPAWGTLAVSMAAAAIGLIVSIAYFRRVEHRLADVI